MKKLFLYGRIYPAIKACVNNRYRALVGLVVYYSFVYRSERFWNMISQEKWIAGIISIAFGIFIVHNSWNYYQNGREQMKLEEHKII